MVAQALEVPVVSRALLPTVGLADRAVHVENQLLERLPLVDRVDPAAGEIHQRRQVALAAERLGLESADLATRRRLLLRLAGPSTNHVSHGGVDAQTLGVVDIFITGQAAVNRLPQQRQQLVLFVLTEA